MSFSPLFRPASRCLLLIGTLSATGAWAGPADYQCDGGGMMKGDFSPRMAQVRYEGENWSLQRVRDSREARYTSAKAGVTVTMVQRTAVLERKGQPKLSCKLVSQALRPEALGMAPAASAPTATAPTPAPAASVMRR
jgi:hypothetical protein